MDQKRKLACFGKAGLFILILILFLYMLDQLFLMKNPDGVMPMRNYYEQPKGQVDAVLLGTSRAGINLDCEQLWKEFGISAYSLWGSKQPFWNTYYFLKEAMRVNLPRSVVLDVHASTYDFEFSDEQRQYTNTGGFLLGRNKIDAVKISAPKEDWLKLILGLPVYHGRFDELTESDFLCLWDGEAKVNKGTTVRFGQGTITEYGSVSGIEDTAQLHDKEETYLRMIIELCQDYKIPIVLIATPSEYRSFKAPYLNRVQEIADSYGIPFINFDQLDSQTGFKPEYFYLDNLHLNTEGARCISSYLGQWLQSEFKLQDHRGDERYSSWEQFAQNEENEYIRMITALDAYLKEIDRDGRKVVWAYNGMIGDSVFERFLELVIHEEEADPVREELSAQDGRVLRIYGEDAGRLLNDIRKTDLQMDLYLGSNHMTLGFYEGQEKICSDLDEYVMNKGIFSIVYDEVSGQIVDISTLFEIDEGKLGEPEAVENLVIKHLF